MFTLIVSVLAGVASAAIGTFGGVIIERRRSRDEDRRRHVGSVRENVLIPLIERIESHLLPFCGGPNSPIELETIRQSGPIGNRDTWDSEWIEDFSPLRFMDSTDQESLKIQDPAIAGPAQRQLNEILYNHVREAHLSSLLQQYENIEESFRVIQAKCVEYASATIFEMSEKLEIPIRRGFNRLEGGGLLRILGLFILDRQLGTTMDVLYIHETPKGPYYEATLSTGGSAYAFGTLNQMKATAELLKHLIEQNEAESFRRNLEEFGVDFRQVITDLKIAESREHLPGDRCDFV